MGRVKNVHWHLLRCLDNSSGFAKGAQLSATKACIPSKATRIVWAWMRPALEAVAINRWFIWMHVVHTSHPRVGWSFATGHYTRVPSNAGIHWISEAKPSREVNF